MAAEDETVFRRPGALSQLRLLITPTGAGARPQQLYKEKARAWRRRNRLLVLFVSLIPLVFAAAFWLMLRPRNASFLWGFALGGSAAMFIGTRELGLRRRVDDAQGAGTRHRRPSALSRRGDVGGEMRVRR